MTAPAEIAQDLAVSAVGAGVSFAAWTQAITGVESVVVGALTIVLISIRIYKHSSK